MGEYMGERSRSRSCRRSKKGKKGNESRSTWQRKRRRKDGSVSSNNRGPEHCGSSVSSNRQRSHRRMHIHNSATRGDIEAADMLSSLKEQFRQMQEAGGAEKKKY